MVQRQVLRDHRRLADRVEGIDTAWKEFFAHLRTLPEQDQRRITGALAPLASPRPPKHPSASRRYHRCPSLGTSDGRPLAAPVSWAVHDIRQLLTGIAIVTSASDLGTVRVRARKQSATTAVLPAPTRAGRCEPSATAVQEGWPADPNMPGTSLCSLPKAT